MSGRTTSVTPETLQQGAVDHGNGTITFALYAPGKQSVHLLGSFNDWDRHADPLELTAEGLWWTEKYLAPGSYTYQFLIDDSLVIGDPYARAIEWNNKKESPRSVLEIGKGPYQWQHNNYARPYFKDLIIYELNPWDFSPEGTIKGIKDRLDYLKALGINAIELMPVFESDSDVGWGYTPTYFFAVNRNYGTADELRDLIDAAHERGIAMVLDIVLAHTGKEHPFIKLYPFDQSPWYGPSLGEPNRFGFPSLDYTKKPTQNFVRDVITYWFQEFHFDGIRFDYLFSIGAKNGYGLPFLVRCSREEHPDAFLIAEYSPEKPDLVVSSGFDGSWHVVARYALIALLRQGRLDEHDWNDFEKVTSYFDPRSHGYDNVFRAINFLETHDEERIIYDTRVVGLSAEEAYVKAALGASVIFTLPGEPMIYNGQEWGEPTRKSLERNPLHWERLETESGRRLYEHVRLLCSMRRDFAALRSENYSVLSRYPDQKVIVYRRWEEKGDEAIIVINFSPSEQSITVPFQKKGTWWEVLNGEVLTAERSAQIRLGPSSAKIFILAEHVSSSVYE